MRLLTVFLLAAAVAPAALTPRALRCEYLTDPEAIETAFPRLSWTLESPDRGERQTAFRVVVTRDAANDADAPVWDSGQVKSSETVNINYAGPSLAPGRRYQWKVQVWDAAGRPSAWSAPAYWRSAPALQDWRAKWISYHDDSPLHERRDQLLLPGTRYYRQRFQAAREVRRAVLYGASLGIFDAYLNGQRVSDAMFSPGWSDYRQRTYYRAWDVTSLVRRGANAVAAEVADGWYAGYVGYGLLVGYGPNKTGRAMYGKTPALFLELRLEFSDGTTQVVATDPTWKVAATPRQEADLLMGEAYDARAEIPAWNDLACDDARWASAVDAAENGRVPALFSDAGGARVMDFGFVAPAKLQAYPGVPVRPIEELRPVRLLEPVPGAYVFDFGQNFSGVVRLRATGPAGAAIRIRHAEMIYPGGKLMTENLRKARAIDRYTLRGDRGGETYTPRFTYHGFQYVELTGYPGKPALDAVTGIVVHSDTPLASRFETSDPMVNRLYRNIVWTQRSNFVEVPTDCPQRDERLGWTGDAQIYARAATYNADTAAFYTKWLDDLDEAQRPNGAFPDYAPYPMQHGAKAAYGTAWMDAGVIVPWSVWQAYGDTRLLQRHWKAMTRFMDFRRRLSPDFRGGNQFNPWGDWLSIGSSTPIEYVDAVYFSYSARLMAEMADVLGKGTEATDYRALYGKVKDRFQQDYLNPDGTLKVVTQTAYVLALAQDLVPPNLRPKSADALAALIAKDGGRMTTGFLGTYPLLPVLSATGHHDLAARLFLSREFPSWGYEVENGATTIWERWNSYTKDKGFHEPSMNSFSHYSFGAVVEWMFRRVAGIESDGPGFRRVIIQPGPMAGLDWVDAEYRSIRGNIATRWKKSADGRFQLDVTIPPNLEAKIAIPARDAKAVREGGKAVTVDRMEEGRAWLHVGSGTWRFESRL